MEHIHIMPTNFWGDHVATFDPQTRINPVLRRCLLGAFEKQYILVPVCEQGVWWLAVIVSLSAMLDVDLEEE